MLEPVTQSNHIEETISKVRGGKTEGYVYMYSSEKRKYQKHNPDMLIEAAEPIKTRGKTLYCIKMK